MMKMEKNRAVHCRGLKIGSLIVAFRSAKAAHLSRSERRQYATTRIFSGIRENSDSPPSLTGILTNSATGFLGGAFHTGNAGLQFHLTPPAPPFLRGGNGRGYAAARIARPRAGLAPLELVLSLFFLLIMMALCINFGSIAAWRVRGNTAARYAVWRTLSLRTGGNFPNPANWQAPATMGLATAIPLNQQTVGQIWSQQDLMQPSLRGPAIVDPSSGNMIPMGSMQYVEMVNQALIGSANLTKQMPLMSKLRKSNIKPLQPVLDHFWRFEEMSPQSNYWAMRSNGDWRLKQFYLHEPSQSTDGSVQNAYMQYQMDDQRLQQNQGIQALQVLDRDPELFGYYQSYPGIDVYPSLGGCEISPQNMQTSANLVPSLINRIEGAGGGGKGGVPEGLANLFLGMYQPQLQTAQQQQPPDQATVSRLQPLVDQLNQFIGTLY